MGSSLAMWSEYFPYGTVVGAELRALKMGRWLLVFTCLFSLHVFR